MNNAVYPWRNEAELAMVKEWFFRRRVSFEPFDVNDSDMRQEAVDRVAVWTYRDADIPTPVVATAALTEAVLHDEIADRRSYISDSALQSIYAMAFCRFVNGLVDRDVAKSSTAVLRAAVADTTPERKTTPTTRSETSMYAYATKIELPLSFVELRHQATHATMPALGRWRRMSAQALDWLFEKWWKLNATADPGPALREIALQVAENEESRWSQNGSRDEGSLHTSRKRERERSQHPESGGFRIGEAEPSAKIPRPDPGTRDVDDRSNIVRS